MAKHHVKIIYYHCDRPFCSASIGSNSPLYFIRGHSMPIPWVPQMPILYPTQYPSPKSGSESCYEHQPIDAYQRRRKYTIYSR